jgi:broad specificity phosphatase PhoE
MQTILLVRHGYVASWDQDLKARGTPPHLRIDPALAEIGRQQAAAVATSVASLGDIDAILSSPFRHCLETADVISSTTKTAVTADWRLGNVLLSQVLGIPFSPNSAMDPEWKARREDAGKPSHPESDRTIQERVTKIMLELKARKPLAQRIVIVSHEIILKELFNKMNGRAITLDWHPGAITTLSRPKLMDRTWKLTGKFASIEHLGELDRCEPADNIVVKYHPNDSRS